MTKYYLPKNRLYNRVTIITQILFNNGDSTVQLTMYFISKHGSEHIFMYI